MSTAGLHRQDSTVTVFKASNYCNISGGEGVGPDEILRQIASNMPPMYGGGDGALLLLGVNHAHSLHEAGLTKRDIQETALGPGQVAGRSLCGRFRRHGACRRPWW